MSSRLRLSKVSPDLWPAALKSVSLRWHTVSPRSNNGSRITVRIRTGHGALISRNYPGENRDSSPLASRGLGPALPGGHGTESIFRKPGNILRGYVEILHSHCAHPASDSPRDGRSCVCVANCRVCLDEKRSNSSMDEYLSGNLTRSLPWSYFLATDFSTATWLTGHWPALLQFFRTFVKKDLI